ncbi:MAG: DNA methyltransferase [Brachybacterium sp.]
MSKSPACHRVLWGDNLDVLAELHAQGERFDCVYLDPPYSAAGALRARGVRVGDWSDFMQPRIAALSRLLAPAGIVVASIDDQHVHHLRVLLDASLGAKNYVGTVVWQGASPNSGRFLSVSHEYLILYCADRRRLLQSGIRWTEPRPDAEMLLEIAAQAWQGAAGDRAAAQALYLGWRARSHPALSAGLQEYRRFDNYGRLYRVGDAGAPPGQAGRCTAQLRHPETGELCPVPRHGWRYDARRLEQLDEQGRIEYGPDATTLPKLRIYLDEHAERRPSSVFRQVSQGKRHLEDLVGRPAHGSHPKDVDVVTRWLGIVTRDQARILDPFLGTGATLEAAMRLNAEGTSTRSVTGVAWAGREADRSLLQGRVEACARRYDDVVMGVKDRTS